MRVLLIEDDSATAQSIELMLKSESFNVYTTDLGEEGVDLGKLYDYDIIVLDLNMPDMHGYEVLKRLRSAKVRTPILILSGDSEPDDKVKGLVFGADDYLTKPYAFAELLARLDALVRRRDPGTVKTKVAVGDLELDLLSRTAKRSGSAIELQPREFRLLEYLMRHAGQVVTRTMLLENVWEYHFDPQTNVIDVHISRLRAKIDKGQERPLLHTVRGAGYTIRDGGR